MGVYIENMEMPKSCYFCPMTNDGFYLCKANNPYKQLEDDCDERRPDWCPLIKLPPHGRLIDADALSSRLTDLAECEWNQNTGTTWAQAFEDVDEFVQDAPTIIEAAEGE